MITKSIYEQHENKSTKPSKCQALLSHHILTSADRLVERKE